MNRDLHRRLVKLERDHHHAAPTCIFADRPLEEGEAASLLANWQEHVASGFGTISGSALVVIRQGPPMTVEEWQAAYCPPETYH